MRPSVCFPAVLALIVFEPFSTSKHSGVLAYFNKRFIKERVFPEELGRSINKAFELRQEGDYREYVELTYDQVEPFIDKAKLFVQKVKDYLEKVVFSSAKGRVNCLDCAKGNGGKLPRKQ